MVLRCWSALFGQAAQDLGTLLDHLVGRRERNAEMGIAAAEDSARNNQQIIPDGFGHEFAAGSPRCFQEQVEGAFAPQSAEHTRR